jgi:hypothetical protein
MRTAWPALRHAHSRAAPRRTEPNRPLAEATMTTFQTTTTTSTVTATMAGAVPALNGLPGTNGPATDADLGPVTYRPGAIPGTADLVFYAVISVHGRLTIVAAAPADAPVHTLHRRTSTGQLRCCPLAAGIAAWATAEVKADNPAGAQVADQLTDSLDAGYRQFAGPVVFTGTDPGNARPVGLTVAQVLLLRALHARSRHARAPRAVGR